MTPAHQAFNLLYDTTTNIVILRLNDCLETETEDTFAMRFQERLQAIEMQGQAWYFVVDVKGCASQSPRIWRMAANAIRLAKQAGMQEKAVLAYRLNPEFYRHGYIQDTDERIHFYFQSEHEALQWLFRLHTRGGKEL